MVYRKNIDDIKTKYYKENRDRILANAKEYNKAKRNKYIDDCDCKNCLIHKVIHRTKKIEQLEKKLKKATKTRTKKPKPVKPPPVEPPPKEKAVEEVQEITVDISGCCGVCIN